MAAYSISSGFAADLLFPPKNNHTVITSNKFFEYFLTKKGCLGFLIKPQGSYVKAKKTLIRKY